MSQLAKKELKRKCASVRWGRSLSFRESIHLSTYFVNICAAKSLMRLHGGADSSEPSLLLIVISAEISCGDSFALLICSSHIITAL